MPESTQQPFPLKKLILFSIASIGFLMLWNYLFPPPQATKQVAEQSQEHVAQSGASTDSGANSVQKEGAAPQAAADQVDLAALKPAKSFPEEINRLTVDGVNLEVSNRGGRVVKALVDDPKRFEAAGDLLGPVPKESLNYPFGTSYSGGIIDIPEDYVYEIVASDSVKTDVGYSKIVYRYTDPGKRFVVDKIYEVDVDKPYQYKLSLITKNLMASAPLKEKVALTIAGYDDPNVEHSFFETRADRYESVCKTDDDLERHQFTKIKDGEVERYPDPTIWGAIDSRYFLFAAIPENPGVSCETYKVDEHYIVTKVEQKELDVKPGQSTTLSWHIYTGPKDFDILTDVGHQLREAVDFGMLSFIARPLRYTLVKIQSVVVNWGLAIIVLTIFIRLLLWPLNHMAYAQTEKMRRIQPKINEIKEKYKGDPQKIQEEQLRLMRESGTTPLGCLPMFFQFPILLALYFMILNSVELYHADFILWYTNLAAKDPYFVLPILMGVTMFLQQHFMAPAVNPDDPTASMQKMMKFMPVIFTVFMLFLPSGVVLYYLVSLIIGLGQQWYIRKTISEKYDRLEAEAAAKT